jgi:hypothetical protein
MHRINHKKAGMSEGLVAGTLLSAHLFTPCTTCLRTLVWVDIKCPVLLLILEARYFMIVCRS